MTSLPQNSKQVQRLRKRSVARSGLLASPAPSWQRWVSGSTPLPSLSATDWPAAEPAETTPGSEFAVIPASDPATLIDTDPVAWITTHFFIPETRGPLTLAPYQQQALRHALTMDVGGRLPYSTVLWSDIKKSAKSTIAAAVCLWWAFQVDARDGWGSLYIIANDLKQADSRVAYYLRRAIQLNPTLSARCHVRAGRYRVTLPHATFIEAIPIDPTGEAGANADAVFFSELWGAHSQAQQQMWTEATLPPNKYGRSFRWVETYAGISGRSPLLEQLYAQTVTDGHRLDPDVELYDAPSVRMLALWNTVPRLAWQTEEYYRQESANLLPSEFARVHRNQWSDGGSERFLPSIELWHACYDPDVPPLSPDEPGILALDAGEADDTYGSAIITWHPYRPGVLALRYARAYIPPPNGVLDFDAIEQDIRDLVTCYAIYMIAYDRFLLGQTIRRLTSGSDPIRTPCEPFNQGNDRLEADAGLLARIAQRTVAQDGRSPDMTDHLNNADRKLDAASKKLRIVKRNQRLKIDLAVTLSMGCHVAAAILPEVVLLAPLTGGARPQFPKGRR